MTRRFFFGLLLAVTTGFLAEARPRSGGSTGGGNVVLCTNPATQQQTVQLLDYYEAEVLMPELKPDLGGSGNELDRVLHVLKRLARLDRNRADAYETLARDFRNNVRWLNHVKLPNINDHGYVPLKPHCTIEQIAIQHLVNFPEAKKYVIREDYWLALSDDEKAGLILHEIIYEEALKLGHKNSVNSRYLNALFSSRKLDTMSLADYRERMIKMGFDVAPGNSPPRWLADPIQITAKENQAVSYSLANQAIDPDSDPLTFQVLAGPAWLTLSSSGTLTGTPGKSNVGDNSFRVRATDPEGHSADVTVKVTVVEENPSGFDVTLPDAHSGRPYSVDLRAYFGSSCSEPLKFGSPDLPHWLTLNPLGQISGVPATGNVGDASFRVMAHCTEQGDLKRFRLRVLPGQAIDIQNPSFTVKERQVFTADLNDPQFISNPSGDPLTFTLVDNADWVQLTAEGKLTLRPLRQHIGDHSLRFRVSDGSVHGEGRISVRVVKDPQPIMWLQDPIVLGDAAVNQAYMKSLASFALDPDGDPLVFGKVAGPAWLMVSASGEVMGTPREGDLGMNSFVVTVSDGQTSAQATLVLKVVK